MTNTPLFPSHAVIQFYDKDKFTPRSLSLFDFIFTAANIVKRKLNLLEEIQNSGQCNSRITAQQQEILAAETVTSLSTAYTCLHSSNNVIYGETTSGLHWLNQSCPDTGQDNVAKMRYINDTHISRSQSQTEMLLLHRDLLDPYIGDLQHIWVVTLIDWVKVMTFRLKMLILAIGGTQMTFLPFKVTKSN